jgi:phosphopantothenoylcysteine synthetase/decarboxylase
LKKLGLLNAARDGTTSDTMPEGVVINAHRVWTKTDDSVAAPRILNMAAHFVKRGHIVDQLSTVVSVFVYKKKIRPNGESKMPATIVLK